MMLSRCGEGRAVRDFVLLRIPHLVFNISECRILLEHRNSERSLSQEKQPQYKFNNIMIIL